ncbi:hypothetical protein DPMN_049887 [Dreissena polymorpha]|uniref:Uncharacterized protein n=1 Tax=Dreissena polymorpha TaxID=45954 RepID=A0A9D4CGQ9_DREPO|nr:hypothetical protein DPMN_049887 [Dreissena polymorpha]
MNLLGVIGSLLEGTGLVNVLEAVYGENSSVLIMSGKAVHEVLRGDFHVDTYLHSEPITEMTQKDPEIQILLNKIKELYSSLLKAESTLADATCYENVLRELYET